MNLRAVSPQTAAGPSGSAGGDLGGNYPNPTVTKSTGGFAIGGKLTSVNGKTTVLNGVPLEMAFAAQTQRAANVASTNLYTVPAGQSGMYRVSAYAVVTQAATTSSTLPNVGIGWTDVDSNTALLSGLVTPTNTANAKGAFGNGDCIIVAAEGTNITYQTSGYASVGATPMQYAVRATLEYLG